MAATTPHSDHIPTRRRPNMTARSLSRNSSNGTSTVSLDGVSTITASAAVLNRRKIDRLKGEHATTHDRWQRDAWRLFDVTPELSYVSRFEANTISRAGLVAAKLPDNPEEKPEIITEKSDPAAMAMSDFLGGRVNQAQEIARISTHLMVAGLSYIVMYDDDETGQRVWMVLSNEEVSWTGAHWKMRINGEDVRRNAEDTLVIRIWTPHGRNRWQPDSPVRHLLPVLSELEALTKHVGATVDSRLAGAGLLIVPQEMTFPHNPDEVPEGEDPFVWSLIEAMSTAIESRDSASSLVPLVLKVPQEVVDKVQHIQFSTDLDDQTRELRDEAIRRVALGVDFPPEILLGLSDVSHWTAWAVEDSSIKLHIEPKLQVICHAATVGYLQPYLKTLGVPDWDRYICWYDITQVKLRPNRAADAQELHDDLLITDEARLRAAGFDASEKPTGEVFRDQLLRKIVTEAPQLGLNLLPLLGIDPVIYEREDDIIPGSRDYEPRNPKDPPQGDPVSEATKPRGKNNNPNNTSEKDPTPNDSKPQPRESNTTRSGPSKSRRAPQ